MAYEPDSRYLKDGLDLKRKSTRRLRSSLKNTQGPVLERRQSHRRSLGACGRILGLEVAVVDPFTGTTRCSDSRVGSLLAFYAVFAAGGLAIGLIAASIRRRVTGEVDHCWIAVGRSGASPGSILAAQTGIIHHANQRKEISAAQNGRRAPARPTSSPPSSVPRRKPRNRPIASRGAWSASSTTTCRPSWRRPTPKRNKTT